MTSGKLDKLDFGELKNKVPKIQRPGVGLVTSLSSPSVLLCCSIKGWARLLVPGAFMNSFGPPACLCSRCTPNPRLALAYRERWLAFAHASTNAARCLCCRYVTQKRASKHKFQETRSCMCVYIYLNMDMSNASIYIYILHIHTHAGTQHAWITTTLCRYIYIYVYVYSHISTHIRMYKWCVNAIPGKVYNSTHLVRRQRWATNIATKPSGRRRGEPSLNAEVDKGHRWQLRTLRRNIPKGQFHLRTTLFRISPF